MNDDQLETVDSNTSQIPQIPRLPKLTDYLTTVGPTLPSFHYRTGKPHLLPETVAPKTPARAAGYPIPGPQSPTPAFATAKHYFVDDYTWDAILDHGDFDDVVCGSGFCALAYIDAALKKNPRRKILVLERGGFWLPEHFQNLPLPFKLVLGGPSETFPWQMTSTTYNSEFKYMHGSCPFFGGRSTFWSAWSPRPGRDLLRDFPQSMIETSEKQGFWKAAEDLLHITPANKLDDVIFKGLQDMIDTRLANGLRNIPFANFSEPARLAVGRTTSLSKKVFHKFSTPGPLLEIYERQRNLAKHGKGSPLMIATDVVVERFEVDAQHPGPDRPPNILHTSRGALCFPSPKTNIILAMGAIPATTILMNSVGDKLKDCAGTRLSGHFLSHIAARFPIPPNTYDHLKIGASYVAGLGRPRPGFEPRRQWHIQITSIHSPKPETDAEDAARLCPDFAAAPSYEQLKHSQNYVVLVCAALGELAEDNDQSWVKHNTRNPDVTTNVNLQLTVSDADRDLWEDMDTATYRAIEVMAAGQNIEYWHNGTAGRPGRWRSTPAPTSEIHVPGVVHETSTLYMSDNLNEDPKASVGPRYNPRGCSNVYVTGGALFPTSGSWNPTPFMCGLAWDLAEKLGGGTPV